MPDLFALEAELTLWEAELPALQGQARLDACIRLAWHLRQRDPARARLLAHDATALLTLLPEEARSLTEARLMLVEGEARWLAGELGAASALADQALMEFYHQGQAIGSADAHWLRAWIAVDRGNSGLSEAELAAAADAAQRAGDSVRCDVFDAASALFAVFADRLSAEARWGGRFVPEDTARHVAVAGWINDYHGTSAFQASEFGHAVSLMMAAFDAALATGQVRRAINLATNIGNGFTSLNAHHAALEWMQRGLDLARPTAWPMSLGLGLMQTAETLRQLGQREAARGLLREALTTLAPLSGSRAYAIALEYQGDLALDSGDHAAALESFARLEERGVALAQSDFQSTAQRGQAHALSQLGRPLEAQVKAEAALALAAENGDAYNRIAALRVLAEIHAQHALPAPRKMVAPNAALHYLQQAMAVAATIDGYTVSADLLAAVAREHARLGDFARAYEVSLHAGAARDKIHSLDATNRAVAMQVQYQTERAKADGVHLRQLARAEALRSEVLQQTSATLEHLSAIGQEIATHLDANAVFRALDRHVHGLLDAMHFSIFMIEADGSALTCAFGTEAGTQLPAMRLSLSDQSISQVRCMRERRELLIEPDPQVPATSIVPGAPPLLSQLYAPLQIGERVLGVMSAQSPRALAYGARERLIFRTLCAYGAIALDNADAYRQVAATLKTLSSKEAQLVEKNLELKRAYKALEEVSLTDQLTGLRNRRFFLQHVEADIAMSLRLYDDPLREVESSGAAPGRDLVFFMVDLDHFKEVNDRHGHAAGDAVLVQMQERLREVFRESDYLIRWGGEEFLVLARATHRDDAKVVAERIRKAVANRPFVLPDGAELAKTCSIGFACFPFVAAEPRLLSWSEVVELADQGLYLVKRSGRNAWAGVYGTPESRYEELFPRLIHQLDKCLADGEARLVTNLKDAQVAAGPKTRRLVVAAAKVTQ